MTTQALPIRLRWRPFCLPMRHRFEAAHGTLDGREGVILQLIDADGVTGTGEASPMASLGQGSLADVIALLETHGAALLGDGLSRHLGAAPGVNALRCGLDVARLDLTGRLSGLPVAALLAGGSSAEWVQANAVIGSGAPDEVARYAVEAWASGYRVLKLKVGTADVDADVARVAAVRAACPEATIRLDANGAWDEATAIVAIDALSALHVELLEEPVAARDVQALARIRERSPMRIAADESVADPETLAAVLEQRAADLVVLKPMLLGGVSSALEVAHRAFERGIGAFATTTFDSAIGTAAALHLAAALPWDAAHGLGTGEYFAADVVSTPLLPRDGRLAIPVGPGLGVDLDEDAFDAVATGPWREVRA